ncbi:nucleoside triphosphate pyrophosphohydrolase [Candidatus Woesearchaeota archaeon]|nr:nucleoside triphosphate pyrophosphohydrolase [Candidatus Woesearchaeota archaeon]
MQKQKLVRDKIPGIYNLKETHIANDEEYINELLKKLQEEVDEFKKSSEIEELVDILEVVYSISGFYGKFIKELEDMRIKKANKRGSFKKRLIWEYD